MKVAPAQTASFLNNPPEGTRVFLFYGPDAGLAQARAKAFAARLVPNLDDPFSVCALNGTDAPARLLDEMATPPLTGGKKLVRVFQAGDALAAVLDDFMKSPPSGDSVLVLEAGDLQKKSKLRALCEAPNNLAAAIACYVEEGAARQKTISSFFEQESIRIPRDALALLAELLPPDHMALQMEMDKLALYAQGQGTLTTEDIRAVVAGAGGTDTDALALAVAGGQGARAMALLDALWAEQTSAVAVLRALQRHFMRLHLARGFMDGGQSAEEALKKFSPPVFWKSVAPMTRQLERWTTPRLEKALAALAEAEAAIKRTGTPDQTLCSQLLLKLSTR